MKYRLRYLSLIVLLLGLVGGLGWRIVSLHVIDQGFLRHQGEMRTVRVVSIPAYRGMITDRFGEPLAISTPVDSVWLNPKDFNAEHPELLTLANLLNISLGELLDKYTKNKDREFVYLQRHIEPQRTAQIKALAIQGIHSKSEYRRYYPAGEVVAHVLGFTDIDDHGQEGLELALDKWLSGAPGSKRVLRDRLGREVQTIEGIKEMRSGQDVSLSLDQRLQYIAYRELKAAVTHHKAASGSAVVIDVNTGEILAMVNQPSFNPNMRVKIEKSAYRNRAVTDVLEPGSVMKTFAVASALQSGQVTPATMVNTAPGWMTVGGHVVKEVKNHNYGTIDVATILKKSSNVGVSKLTLSLPAERLWEMYTGVGFGKSTGSGFPGESAGSLVCPSKHSSFVLATLAFGYGISVTPLQLAQAYAVLGAGGVKRPITFLKQETQTVAERVMEPQIARQVLDMLVGIVKEGSGTKAQVLGYQVGGKTGTTRKLNPAGGYDENSHVAVFAGLAPASHPRFAIVVMIDDPKGEQYYGSQVAAPVFSKIAASALRLYNLPLDLIDVDNIRVAKAIEEGSRPSLHE
jgi:cell division protein FtsI (penicillin-binding protein 3)